MSERRQCSEMVYVRDCYRRTGRGKYGFEMHYARRLCKRRAVRGRDYCRQHLAFHRTEPFAPFPSPAPDPRER